MRVQRVRVPQQYLGHDAGGEPTLRLQSMGITTGFHGSGSGGVSDCGAQCPTCAWTRLRKLLPQLTATVPMFRPARASRERPLQRKGVLLDANWHHDRRRLNVVDRFQRKHKSHNLRDTSCNGRIGSEE